jgi:hypothetical protein
VQPVPVQEQSGEPLQVTLQPPEQFVIWQDVVPWQLTEQSPPVQSSEHDPPVHVCEQSPPGQVIVHEPPVQVCEQSPCVHCIEHVALVHVCEQSLWAQADVQLEPVPHVYEQSLRGSAQSSVHVAPGAQVQTGSEPVHEKP